ncbi:MAG: DNA adenine methylase [Ktedonobacterales bacterium]
MSLITASLTPRLTPSVSGPVLKYRGSKWRLAPWILRHFPAPSTFTTYIEPYFGSGAVFFAKSPSKHEILNDLSGEVVNLFRVLREHGQALAALIQMTPWARAEYDASFDACYTACDEHLEAARRFLVRCWQAQHLDFTRRTAWRHCGRDTHSSTTALWQKLPTRLLEAVARLQQAEIECLPALEVIARHQHAHVLLYVDPPYVLATRGRRRLYEHELSDAEHEALLAALNAHPGPVILSGYAHPLYDERLAHWTRDEAPAVAEGGGRRTEVLWVKPAQLQTPRLASL